MYGASSFGAAPFGAMPFVWRLICDASGSAAGVAAIDGQVSALASGSGLVPQAATVEGGLCAQFSSSVAISISALLTPAATIVRNTIGLATQAVGLAAVGSAFGSSSGCMPGSVAFVGYRMRAYDQQFPAGIANGSTVQIGKRFYVWRSNSGRWQPKGLVP